MSMTRRQFTAASTSLIALTVLGCGKSETPAPERKKKPPAPTEAFLVGDPAQYRAPGLYDQFNADKRLWLYSDGKTLVALADFCTHRECGLEYQPADNRLHCPCHGSNFDYQGTPTPDSKAKRPLDRWAISLATTPQGPQVRIDPTRKFRKDEKENQWSDPLASLTLPA